MLGRRVAMGVTVQYAATTFWHVSCHLAEHTQAQQTGWSPGQQPSSVYAGPHV